MPDDLFDETDDTFDDVVTGSPGAGDDDFDVEIPPVICGVLRMHIAEIKKWDKDNSVVLMELKCEEALHRGTKFTQWFRCTRQQDIRQLGSVCKHLGVPTKTAGRRFSIVGGLKALKNKSGLFFVSTYVKRDASEEPQLAAYIPKPGKSPAWDEYIAARPLSDEQKKALSASSGAIPEAQQALFEGFNVVD